MVYCTDHNTTENVAAGHFGITVTASTVNAHNDPALGIDGNEGTRWESSFADAQWYEIDLGTQRSLCAATILWENAAASLFAVQVCLAPAIARRTRHLARPADLPSSPR